MSEARPESALVALDRATAAVEGAVLCGNFCWLAAAKFRTPFEQLPARRDQLKTLHAIAVEAFGRCALRLRAVADSDCAHDTAIAYVSRVLSTYSTALNPRLPFPSDESRVVALGAELRDEIDVDATRALLNRMKVEHTRAVRLVAAEAAGLASGFTPRDEPPAVEPGPKLLVITPDDETPKGLADASESATIAAPSDAGKPVLRDPGGDLKSRYAAAWHSADDPLPPWADERFSLDGTVKQLVAWLRYGSSAENRRFRRFIMDDMKLDPEGAAEAFRCWKERLPVTF